ncbi:hypothetical protein GCM10007907_05950 [Chitinimonas prasina]|uniref:Uncharacterized protein n=1 Tax=Chitinimonas prasina TaxID=1434937 RepID=A0ABQ5YA19_9NEIS|nr:hypothetical protein [Chitinimonas prasina]GLR11805.1 hypothetical protein GCM10007907_05950 [Chitinimonas prasina]
MHDWTLVSLAFDWKDACVTLTLLNPNSETVSLKAENVVRLFVPKRNDWGRSVSVNGVMGPTQQADGTETLQIEMQSGDIIEIAAGSFVLPLRTG